ncbi:hypothetical protein RFI_35231, partial [Reticulomyxa filosa]
EIEKAEKKLKKAFEKEITSNEESLDNYKKLTQFNIKSCVKHRDKDKECRQDNDLNGVKSIFNEQKLLKMQINSNEATFNLKHVYDFEMYLNELLARAHIMNDSFQTEMENIFRSCEGCKFEPGPIKTHNQCKLKAQVEYKDKKFPKSAHIIDVLRCQATFPNIERLVQGLEHFTSLIRSPQYSEKFKVVRVKNGFEDAQQGKSDNDNNEITSFNIPQKNKDVRINILFKKDGKSIVGEVQFLLEIVSVFNYKTHPFYEISRQESFIQGSFEIMDKLPFDKQLQIASFNRRDMANLMFYFPNKFRHSSFIHSLGPNGENFISQMANNSNVTYDYANLLFYNGDFFSDEFVQSQLITADENGTYPLMYAVSKQRSIECIKLFVPSNEKSKYSVWNSLNNVKKRMYNIYAYITNEITKCFKKQSCIGLAVRNTNVNVLELLNWLKAEIDKDNWQKFIEIQDINQGLTPLMNALIHQSKLNDDIIQSLIPQNFKENYKFWECKCNEYGVNTFYEKFLFKFQI